MREGRERGRGEREDRGGLGGVVLKRVAVDCDSGRTGKETMVRGKLKILRRRNSQKSESCVLIIWTMILLYFFVVFTTLYLTPLKVLV